MNPIYKIIVPVWGPTFVARFLRYCLPTQLAPGNLPALRADRCAYHIFTTSADAEEIRGSSVYRCLRDVMPAFIETIDDVYRGHAYAAMTECHNRGLALGRGGDCAFVFPPPDSLWAEGAFRAMHAQIEAGKRAVLMAGPRVVAEAVLQIAEANLSPAEPILRLTAREVAALILQHMHPTARAYLWQAGGNRGAGHYFWKVERQGLLIRATHLHPIAVRPVDMDTRLITNLDGDFVGCCCPDVSQLHIVTDSDEMCALEFSNADYLEGFYPDAPLSRAEQIAFIEKNTDSHHRNHLRRCIRIHAAEIGNEWRQVEAESEAVITELLREFESRSPEAPPIEHRAGAPSTSRFRRLKRAILDEPVRFIRLGPIDPNGIKRDGKHAFVIDLGELGVFARSDLEYQRRAGSQGVSRLTLLEDGKPLGPAHQMHDVIRNKGMGRFSHWGEGLHFSTSDNSDPRTNGRLYTILAPESLAGFVRRGWWRLKRRLRTAG
jgi:hypothetical protein